MIEATPWSVLIRDHYRDLLAGVSLGAMFALPLKLALGLLAAGFAASGVGAAVVLGVGLLVGLSYLGYRLYKSYQKREMLFTTIPTKVSELEAVTSTLETRTQQERQALAKLSEEYIQLTAREKLEGDRLAAAVQSHQEQLAQSVATAESVTEQDVIPTAEEDTSTWAKVKRFFGITASYTRDAVVVEGVTDLDLNNQLSKTFIGLCLLISSVVTLLLSPFIYQANKIEDEKIKNFHKTIDAKNKASIKAAHATNQTATQQRLSQDYEAKTTLLADCEQHGREQLYKHEEDGFRDGMRTIAVMAPVVVQYAAAGAQAHSRVADAVDQQLQQAQAAGSVVPSTHRP